MTKTPTQLKQGWLETDLSDIESWISVDDALPERSWLVDAQSQLLDQNVLLE